MSDDLCWKKTPIKQKEEYNSLYKTTWWFLTDVFGLLDKRNLEGKMLTKDNLQLLQTILLTSKASGNDELTTDIQELINSIIKFDSITLYIQS